MFRNYLITAVRSLKKQKTHAGINVLGLAIGMACCILIGLWMADELDYDRFHDHHDRLYRVVRSYDAGRGERRTTLVPAPMADALRSNYPDIEAATRYSDEGPQVIRYGDVKLQDEILALADADFLEMFSFPLVAGSTERVFQDPLSIALTRSTCARLFGEHDPLGRTISIGDREFTVAGVLADPPRNSHLQFGCLASFDSRPEHLREMTATWMASAYYTYVMIREDASAEHVAGRIAGLMDEHIPERDYRTTLSLQPLTDIHLNRDFEDYLQGHGDIRYVRLFSLLALVVLIIACMNYTNLATARAAGRADEIGIRRSVGASTSDLIKQNLGESLILTGVALAAAIALAELCLPAFNAVAGKSLTLDILGNPVIMAGLGLLALLTAVLAGGYPAFYLPKLTPAAALAGKKPRLGRRVSLRSVLVVIQFMLSAIMIIVAATVYSQLDFIQDRKLGFNQENVVYASITPAIARDYDAIEEELLRHPDVASVSAGLAPVEMFDPAVSVAWEGRPRAEDEDELVWRCLPTDRDYIETLGMNIVEGMSFADRNSDEGFIVNQAAAEAMGSGSPVGKQLSFGVYRFAITPEERSGPVIGVVEDFHGMSLHAEIEPVVIEIDKRALASLIVRARAGKTAEVIDLMGGIWDERAPGARFEPHFLDRTIESFYATEQRLAVIFESATALALIMATLGLFGLVSFAVSRRMRELAVRKVLGATIGRVVGMLAREFVWLVVIANILAWPVAYYAMSRWLEGFAYRIDLGPTIFLLTGTLVLFVTVTTVSLSSLKIAVTNPSKVLRDE